MEVVSKQKEALLTDDYLDGHYRWGEDIRLVTARLRGVPPLKGSLKIALEIDGELTDHVFTVPAGRSPEIRQDLSINEVLPADTEMRWKVISFTGEDEDASVRMAVVVSAFVFTTGAVLPVPVTDLHVDWINGSTRIRLFDYNPTTDVFTEHETGIATGRLVISSTPGASHTFTIDGSLAMEIEDGELRVNDLYENDLTPEYPAIQFMSGGIALATLTKSGRLHAGVLVEDAPLTGDAEAFEFRTAGPTLAVVLRRTGLWAREFVEPITP